MDAQPIVAWAAPVAATLVTCAGQLALNARFKRADEKRDEARADAATKQAAEAKWRDDMERRMDEFEKALLSQDKKIDSVLRGQLTQMRSDLVHKAHRYIDDLGCASTEEKNAFDAQYNDYAAICEANGVKNDFIRSLHEQVKALPGRTVREG